MATDATGDEQRWTSSLLTDDERARLIRRADDQPAVHAPGVDTLYHFSEDGQIKRFAPHVPPTNPSHPPAVWAIDEVHAPLYWFPRDCPRISVWAHSAAEQQRLSELFDTEASRICAAESHWYRGIRAARLYRYRFDAASFVPWTEADGQYISDAPVHPDGVDVLDDLLGMHADADVELRLTPRLGIVMDRVLASGLRFSFVRIRDAIR